MEDLETPIADCTDLLPDTKEAVDKLTYLVAIGASAGGLQALQEFFRHLNPKTNASYVVIQHLSPDYKSMMDEILSRDTSMPVSTATNGEILLPNRVYVIPPAHDISLNKNTLVLTEIQKELGISLPIDYFFRSAAANYGFRCIGIILSGTGSDGSRGIKEIKEAGGIVMIQSPESAIFTGMPLNAKKAIKADFILSPKELALEISQYLTNPLITEREHSLKLKLENREHIMSEIFELLNRVHNIDFSYYRPSTIAHRLERRMGILQINKIEEYLSVLKKSDEELAKLCTDLLIGVTSFFRDNDAFKYLQKHVVEKLILNGEINEEIRIWDVACSSGEEAYSLAILFSEALEHFNSEVTVKIFATDVDHQAIADASIGTYTKESLQDINPDWIKKYFIQQKDKYTICPKIRRMVLFAVHDITKDPAFSSLDLIVCRNVLIYFQHAAQKRIISTLHFALNRSGFLFLGPSETLGDYASQFRTISETYKIYENITEGRAPRTILDPTENKLHSRLPLVSHLVKSHRTLQQSEEMSKICEFLVREYMPVTIILNHEFKIEYIYGEAGDFLIKPSSGKISTHLLDLIAPELSVPIGTALDKIENEKTRYTYTDIKFKIKDQYKLLSIDAIPFFKDDIINSYIVIIYIQQEQNQSNSSTPRYQPAKNFATTLVKKYDESIEPYLRIKQLEEELVLKHSHLQTIIKELESTNEEIQSSNEELLLSNEELQSTNEEIQSMNEELYTLNSEYQQKIMELTETNNDMQNLMKSTEIGMIFLDESYNIRRFTPNTTNYVPLVESDVGRSFFHFSNRLNSGKNTIESDVRSVSVFGNIIERTITLPDSPGVCLLIRILPYTKQSHETNGVVITITDISNIVHTEKKLEQAVEMLGKSIKEQLTMDKQRHYQVAVLDDEIIDCKNIQHLLGKSLYSSYKVDVYTNYDSIAKAMLSKNYDVIFLDYYLGPINAIELLQSNKNSFHNTPIVLMSGESAIQNKAEEFSRFSVYDIVPKNDLSTPLLERSIRYAIRIHEVSEFTRGIEAKLN